MSPRVPSSWLDGAGVWVKAVIIMDSAAAIAQ